MTNCVCNTLLFQTVAVAGRLWSANKTKQHACLCSHAPVYNSDLYSFCSALPIICTIQSCVGVILSPAATAASVAEAAAISATACRSQASEVFFLNGLRPSMSLNIKARLLLRSVTPRKDPR